MSTGADGLKARLAPLLGTAQGLPALKGPNAREMEGPASLVYRWYTQRLLREVIGGPMPRHVAVILDGNRRFARRYGLSNLADGYRQGAGKVDELVEWCDELAIPAITLWCLSVDNLRRPQADLAMIFQTAREWLDTTRRKLSTGPNHRRVQAVGRLHLLPPDILSRLRDIERLTASAKPWLLNVAIAYGGREELVDALRRMLLARAALGETVQDAADSLSAETLCQYLYAPAVPEPDLIIRTSGEVRLSGFLLWQSVYSELYFCDALWPAFRKLDFLRAIRSFQRRKRRFGL